jgi:hypothetical protein
MRRLKLILLAVPVVILGFYFLLGCLGFVKTQSSKLPSVLNGNLTSFAGALIKYHDDHGQFPESMSEIPHASGDSATDPYAAKDAPFGYKRVVDSTHEEHCEVYTARLATPAYIVGATSEGDKSGYYRKYTPEFSKLWVSEIAAEVEERAAGPKAGIFERMLVSAKLMRASLFSLFPGSDQSVEETPESGEGL